VKPREFKALWGAGVKNHRHNTPLEKPRAPATGGGIENHRQNMAVVLNNAARQLSLARATGFLKTRATRGI